MDFIFNDDQIVGVGGDDIVLDYTVRQQLLLNKVNFNHSK